MFIFELLLKSKLCPFAKALGAASNPLKQMVQGSNKMLCTLRLVVFVGLKGFCVTCCAFLNVASTCCDTQDVTSLYLQVLNGTLIPL